MKISDLYEKKAMTIVAAVDSADGIDRDKAEKITDPKGWFARNKKNSKKVDKE